MEDFLVNFLANLAADALIGIILYIAITQPSEKRAARRRLRQALGLLKAELALNAARARSYIEKISVSGDELDIEALFPLRFTRGAWNALKESGFLPQINDPRLVYYLLRANEATFVANQHLAKFRSAVLGGDKGIGVLAEKVRQDSEHLLEATSPLLSMLDKMDLPSFTQKELYEA